jgi:hypothetical protein
VFVLVDDDANASRRDEGLAVMTQYSRLGGLQEFHVAQELDAGFVLRPFDWECLPDARTLLAVAA